MSETKERLLQFLRYKKLGQQKFEISIGMSNGWANKVGDSIRENTLQKIKEVYPELNIAWLKSGVGEMLNAGDSEGTLETPGDNETSEEITAKLVPLLPIAAQGGSLNDFVVSVKESDCEKVVSPIKGADFAMPISGDSMAPEYPNGSQIFIKRINERAFIEWGKVYVLDTCNGVVVKILVPSQKEGYVRCVSINTDPIFAPFEIAWEDINGVTEFYFVCRLNSLDMEKYYRMVIDLYKEVITTNYQVNSDRILEVQTEIANASTEARIKDHPDKPLLELIEDLQPLKSIAL